MRLESTIADNVETIEALETDVADNQETIEMLESQIEELNEAVDKHKDCIRALEEKIDYMHEARAEDTQVGVHRSHNASADIDSPDQDITNLRESLHRERRHHQRSKEDFGQAIKRLVKQHQAAEREAERVKADAREQLDRQSEQMREDRRIKQEDVGRADFGNRKSLLQKSARRTGRRRGFFES